MDGHDTFMGAGYQATQAARRRIAEGGVQQVSGVPWNFGHGEQAAITRSLPEEMPVAIMAGKRPAAVVIASPADYADLGWGFVLTEGIAKQPADIIDCTVTEVDGGIRVMVQLAQPRSARERVLPGRSRAAIESAGDAYVAAERVIIAYGMGMTQHRNGTANVQQMMNLLLLRGNVGRKGAGLAPIRGHSNVQGDRTVGITEIPNPALLDGIERAFGFRPPSAFGHNAVGAAQAIIEGRARAMVALGGNFAVAMSDPTTIQAAIRNLDLAVHLGTKLNRTHLMAARQSFILPVLGRTELDLQAGCPQAVTVEDSVSMVHASRGRLKPASEHLRSECAVIAGMAKATLHGRYGIDWDGLVADYDRIRDKIEIVFPDFKDYNARIRKPGGFLLDVAASHREWRTPNKKANFVVMNGLSEDPRGKGDGVLLLTTLRSHDQYNTTIYGFDDRYRGVFGRRDILFMHQEDLAARGLAPGDAVEVEAVPVTGDAPDRRRAITLTAIAYDVPRGCAAAYYPEANILVPLAHFDPKSGTPSYKTVPVRVRGAAAA